MIDAAVKPTWHAGLTADPATTLEHLAGTLVGMAPAP
jgi:hypothetical protein